MSAYGQSEYGDELDDNIGMDESHPLTVSQLTVCIKRLLEQALPTLWLEAEIGDLSQPSSGHCYMTLKDSQCQIRAVMWRSAAQRLRFKLEDGQSVVCFGGVEVYPPRGTYQLVIQRIQPKGMGDLQLAFQQLHKRLNAEGLFQAERKKPLPAYASRIGFVTSPSGAAVHDFIEAARERWPMMELVIIPAKVQGEGAAADIVRGIRMAAKIRPRLDVLIVGRGGGSVDDLWCFNEESVVRALAASPIPTVSAVGHEVDVTLSDLVADARALTPTHAAEVVLASAREIRNYLDQVQQRTMLQQYARLENLRHRVEQLGHARILANPHETVFMRRQMLDEFELRARNAAWNGLRSQNERLQGMARAAHALSPLQVLARGYSLTSRKETGQLLRNASDVVIGEHLHTVLEQGSVTSQVIEVVPETLLVLPTESVPSQKARSTEKSKSKASVSDSLPKKSRRKTDL